MSVHVSVGLSGFRTEARGIEVYQSGRIDTQGVGVGWLS